MPVAAARESRQQQARAGNTPRSVYIVVGLLAASLILTRVMTVGPISANLSLADLVLIPAFLILYRRFRGHSSFHYWLLALLVMQAVSWFNGLEYATIDIAKDVLAIFATCAYGLVGFGIGHLRDGERAFTTGMLLTVIPTCLLMIVAAVTRQPRWFLEPDLLRVRGPMTDPNGMAIYLAGGLPLVAGRSLWWLPVLLIGILTTASRTGAAATGAALVAWVVLQRRLSYLLALVLVALPVILILLPSAQMQRLMTMERGLAERAETWNVAWQTAKLHPFVGVGKGNYERTKIRQAPGAHNTYLHMLVGNGFIGLALFFVPILYWALRPYLIGTRNPWAVTIVACLVGGMAVSLWDWRLFWLAVGATNGYHVSGRVGEVT